MDARGSSNIFFFAGMGLAAAASWPHFEQSSWEVGRLLPGRALPCRVESPPVHMTCAGAGPARFVQLLACTEFLQVTQRLPCAATAAMCGLESGCLALPCLPQQYKSHEPSREAVELAFEKVLSEHMKRRKAGGFRPPQRGKRGEVQGDAPVSTLLACLPACRGGRVYACVHDTSIYKPGRPGQREGWSWCRPVGQQGRMRGLGMASVDLAGTAMPPCLPPGRAAA